MKKTILLLLSSLLIITAGHSAIAATTVSVQITSIRVQDNRTWIAVSPSIGTATSCSIKNSVELSNNNQNRDLIATIALTALTNGTPVSFLTTNNCSNVNQDVIFGIIMSQ